MAERLETSSILWQEQAEFEARKNRDLRFQHGSGPSNIFILDISSSIGDEGVRQMKEAFTTIIDEYSKHPDIDENVAVIICGRETKFLRYFSNQYEDIKSCLDDIEFGGPSPLTAAFLLSHGGLNNDASNICWMANFHFHQRLILISDGRPTDFTIISADDTPVMETDEAKRHLLQTAIIIGRVHPIFCVPIGSNPNLRILEFISGHSKGGKLVRYQDAMQLGKCSYNLRAASVMLQTMKNDCHDKERVVASLALHFPYTAFTEKDKEDIFEMCTRKTLFCSYVEQKVESGEETDLFKERNPIMPCLGSRVRRGRDWKWDNQDNRGPGTVIGHHIKGTDWEWDDQDGGAGNIGSVISVHSTGIVIVRWRNGFISQYRFGCHGKFDLTICDPFSEESIEYLKEQERNAALNYPNGDQASFSDALGLPSNRPAISERAQSVDTLTKPILHVVKGKYFKNSEGVDKITPENRRGRPMNQWFWKDDKGKWNPYSIEMNDRINECYKRDPKSTVVVTVQDQSYRVVMSKSLHINLSTKEESEVILVKNGANL
uniref:E3 ubiquitin-protein ligase HERC2 n=1 Tax=Magallana gigas TaxID=29159 RepID=A0A8W8I4G3_MAGGI